MAFFTAATVIGAGASLLGGIFSGGRAKIQAQTRAIELETSAASAQRQQVAAEKNKISQVESERISSNLRKQQIMRQIGLSQANVAGMASGRGPGSESTIASVLLSTDLDYKRQLEFESMSSEMRQRIINEQPDSFSLQAQAFSGAASALYDNAGQTGFLTGLSTALSGLGQTAMMAINQNAPTPAVAPQVYLGQTTSNLAASLMPGAPTPPLPGSN